MTTPNNVTIFYQNILRKLGLTVSMVMVDGHLIHMVSGAPETKIVLETYSEDLNPEIQKIEIDKSELLF